MINMFGTLRTLHYNNEDLMGHLQWNSARKDDKTPTYLVGNTSGGTGSMHVHETPLF
jgi:hypothetical protein